MAVRVLSRVSCQRYANVMYQVEVILIASHLAASNAVTWRQCHRNWTSTSTRSMIAIRERLDDILSTRDGSSLTAEKKTFSLCQMYQTLSSDERSLFLSTLAREYNIDHDVVGHMAHSLPKSKKDREVGVTLRIEERLRHALTPRYQQLFTQISRLENGVKFLVDLRTDLLVMLSSSGSESDVPHLQSMNSSLHDLLSLWFSVGFLRLERITWESPCDMLQKVSEYEAVHPIRNWTDLKQRVGPYRRCYVFTHHSMPREPVVVLHTALASEIASSIQSIVLKPRLSGSNVSGESTPEDGREEKEDTTRVNTAIFYSITSTQKGLQGVELGNYLIKSVIRELLIEIPNITQFSSLSPIPGFRDWLVGEINRCIHTNENNNHFSQNLLKKEELVQLASSLNIQDTEVLEALRKVLLSNSWITNDSLITILRPPLMRLCAQYLYNEKRRGFALNPVANFHLRNGAVMWRLNWLADKTARGLTASCSMMVNYRYLLDQTEENSRAYMECQEIAASDQFLELLKHDQSISSHY